MCIYIYKHPHHIASDNNEEVKGATYSWAKNGNNTKISISRLEQIFSKIYVYQTMIM